MLQNLNEIQTSQLVSVAQDMMNKGYRFVTATCVTSGDNMVDITYHFDKNYELMNYRVKLDRSEEVPSISGIYFCALLVENEINELFGVKVKDIAIDYGGHLLLSEDAPDSPMFGGGQIVIEKRGAQK